MASIRKKNQKWQVQIRRKGFAPISKTFLKKIDAIEWSRMMESKADRRDLPQTTKILDQTTLGDLVRRYRDEVASLKKCASVEVIVLNAFLRHRICKKFLSSVTNVDWIRYRDERLSDITGKSLKRELSPIRHMFGIAAKDWGLPISENPIAHLSIKCIDQKRDRRLESFEEWTLLAEAARTRAGYLEAIVKLALETAMRRGELLKVRRDHIDIKRSLLRIPETKNGDSRTIPLKAEALEILIGRLSICSDSGRLFDVSETALRLSWDRVCKKANIENLHFHDLRHEAISRFFEMGLTTPEVALISGHKDVRMLFRYAHGSQRAILEKFQRASLMTGEQL